VVRALELWQAGGTLVPERPRLWSAELRLRSLVVGLDVQHDTLAARIHTRTAAMFEQGVEEEVHAAGEVVPQVLGLDAVRGLPRPEAIVELERGTLRFSAYQRKWMRRIPGVVIIDANRPATEVANEIVALARARERVPGDGAVRADG
jgi:tRNA A37 N6-isopentenylltransferase MiaA